MIPASMNLPSTTSRTIAASSIQGIGAHSFSIAIRAGCADVSGIELGPNWADKRRASSLVRPLGDSVVVPLAEASTEAGTAMGGARGINQVLSHISCAGGPASYGVPNRQ